MKPFTVLLVAALSVYIGSQGTGAFWGGIKLPSFRLPSVRIRVPPVRIPTPRIRIPTPRIRVPPPRIRIPPPQIRIPKPRIRIPKPRIRIPKPRIRIPKPRIRIRTPIIKVPLPKIKITLPKLPKLPKPKLFPKLPKVPPCIPPKYLDNGFVIVLKKHLVLFKCDAGYRMSGPDKAACGMGQWSSFPNCEVIKCGALINKQGDIYINASVAPVGYIQKFNTSLCGEGARLVGEKEVKCESSGNWDKPAPECEVIKCGALTNKQGYVYINASVATVGYIQKFNTSLCGEGARIVGAKEVKCQSNETWDNPAPDCEVIKCGALTNKQGYVYINASVANVGYIQKFDTTFCGEGAHFVGAKEVQCQSSGNWNHPAPECEAITCDTLTDQNGTVYVDAGAVAGYIHLFSASMCEIGQQLIGVQEVKCQMNGTWDNPAPQCQDIVTCDGVVISNTTYFKNVHAGFNYTFTDCPALGNITIICRKDGTWNQKPPLGCPSN